MGKRRRLTRKQVDEIPLGWLVSYAGTKATLNYIRLRIRERQKAESRFGNPRLQGLRARGT